ncbi:MAG: ATP-binding cassette domain-containing protein, partial [Clostridia bacterium]
LEANRAEEYREKLGIKAPSVEQLVSNLSGGNQQKVLVGKWMFAQPDIMLLDEPTRGVDVGAKYEIYQIINDLVAQGKSILMISSELPEISGMCDRIYGINESWCTIDCISPRLFLAQYALTYQYFVVERNWLKRSRPFPTESIAFMG